MIVLGFDPGGATGVAVIQTDSKNVEGIQELRNSEVEGSPGGRGLLEDRGAAWWNHVDSIPPLQKSSTTRSNGTMSSRIDGDEMTETATDVQAALDTLQHLPPEHRAAVAHRLLDELYLSDVPDNRKLRGAAEREDLRRRLAIQVHRVMECWAAWDNPTPDPSRIDTSRGAPRIRETRITIYSLVDFLIYGWGCSQIEAVFPLVKLEDVIAAVDYIQAHLDEVVADYQSILERHRKYRRNVDPKEQLASTRKRVLERWEQLKREKESNTKREEAHAGDPLRS